MCPRIAGRAILLRVSVRTPKYVFQLNFPNTWRQAAWAHPDIQQIVVPVEGSLEVILGNERLKAELGSAILFPRNMVYEERTLGAAPLTLLYVGWEGPDDEVLSLPRKSFDKQGRMAFLLRWMRELHPARNAEQTELLEGLLGALLHEYRTGLNSPVDERLLRVRRMVSENLDKPLGVSDLAKVAGISRSRFCRAFRSDTGQSPMEYVRQERLLATKTLLVTTPLNLAEIAAQVGFRNEFELSRSFRKATGQSPTQFRSGGREQ